MERFNVLPRDLQLRVIQKFDMDTRIMTGVIGRIHVPTRLVKRCNRSRVCIASTDSRLVQKQDKSTLHKCRKNNNYPDKHGFTGAHTNDIMMEVFGLHLIWMWKNQSAFIKPCCIHQMHMDAGKAHSQIQWVCLLTL
jgi:hypothetical protein